jgi:hypothetical protein
MRVTGTGASPNRRQNERQLQTDQFTTPNPMMIVVKKANVRVCQGCPKPITAKETQHPKNLLFTLLARRSYIDPKTGEPKTAIRPSPIYFHLNENCVQKYHTTWTLNQMEIHPKVFKELDGGQMSYLVDIDYMQYLI